MKPANVRQPSLWKARFVSEGAAASAMGLLALVVALLLCASPLFAQTNPMVERLPADTWAYLSWGGTASLKSASSTNTVLRLWNDPAFSALLENSFATVSHGGGAAKSSGLTPERMAEIRSALENPVVIGFVNQGFANQGENSDAMGHGLPSYFLIYDATGKKELIDKLRHERDEHMTERPQVSTIPIGGVSVEKRVSKGGDTSYEAQAGSYYIVAGSRHTMAELLTRFGAGAAPAVSFTQAADFPTECREMARDATLSALALPGRISIPAQAGNAGFDFRAFSSSLHLDQIRAACMGVTFEKQITHTRGAVLGDTSRGSILNVAGDNRDSFATLPLASANSSFKGSVVDYAGLYNSLFTAISAGLPGNRAPFLAAVVAFLTSTWGMPPDQALGLFTGEFAVIHPDNTTDPSQSFYAATIHDPDKVVHILEHLLPGERASTNQDGDVIYLTTTFSGVPASGKPGQGLVIYFALTPNMLIASKEQDVLRRAVARMHSTTGAAQADALAGDPDFQKARATLPAKLNSLSYTNYAHYNWPKLFAETQKSLNEQMQEAARKANRPAPPPVQIFQGMDPAMLARYLHVSIGGGWKNATGVYFDSYIQ